MQQHLPLVCWEGSPRAKSLSWFLKSKCTTYLQKVQTNCQTTTNNCQKVANIEENAKNVNVRANKNFEKLQKSICQYISLKIN